MLLVLQLSGFILSENWGYHRAGGVSYTIPSVTAGLNSPPLIL